MTSKTIAIIDYGSGNLRSAAKAFERVIADRALSFRVLVTDKASDVANAAAIVLPGQGAFGDCIAGLKAVPGMIDALSENVLHKKTPFMGICVGMQLLADEGHEHGVHQGLGWIPGKVVKIIPAHADLKIPHMGWNTLSYCAQTPQQSHPALQHNQGSDHFYFVHSFVFESKEKAHHIASVDYGQSYAAIVGRDNMIGVQFHPEKSQESGLNLIAGFLDWANTGAVR